MEVCLRKNGWLRPIGHFKTYRCASRNLWQRMVDAREAGSNRALSCSLEWSRINKQKIELLKHSKSSPKSEGIVSVIVSPMKRWSWFSGACRGRSRVLRVQFRPKSQNNKMRYTNIQVHVTFKLYLGVACWKLGRLDLESQTDTRNGMDFEFLTDSVSRSYAHNFSLFVEIWNNSLWLSMRNLMS